MINGILLLIAAGFFQGSFGLGYKKYAPFTWAAFWCVYSIMCVALPTAAAHLLAGDATLTAAPLPFCCGALWGLSAIGFSKAIDKIGMSMVYGISMGVSTITGSVIPMIMDGIPGDTKIRSLLPGYFLTIAGVAVITAAGAKRDGGVKGSRTGILLAVFSGLGSGAMNIGFQFVTVSGAPTYLAESALRWLPVLWGGGLMSVLWCIAELSKKRGWKSLTGRKAGRRYIILLVVSMVWYGALLLYGVSVNMLDGALGAMGWLLFHALALIVSLVWGIVSGEWKGHSKKMLYCGCALLVAAWILIGG